VVFDRPPPETYFTLAFLGRETWGIGLIFFD